MTTTNPAPSKIDNLRFRQYSMGLLTGLITAHATGDIECIAGMGHEASFTRTASGWVWVETSSEGFVSEGSVSIPANLERIIRRAC